MSKKQSKGELAILESLYSMYRENLENKDILRYIDTIAWELTFSLEANGVFHYLAELVEGTIYNNSDPVDSHYTQEIERILAGLRKDPENFY
jgi:hypothetical protein